MEDAPPDKIIVCTKGLVASDFKAGTIFGVSEHAESLGTTDYLKKDAVVDVLQLARDGEIDNDLRSLIHRIKKL